LEVAALYRGDRVRPRKSIILFDEAQQSGSELTFILNTAIHAKVHRVDSPESYSAALETETYDLAILIDSGDKRPALVGLNAHIPILFTSAKRTSCNAQLIEEAKRLLARKRGPRPAVMPVQVLSEVA